MVDIEKGACVILEPIMFIILMDMVMQFYDYLETINESSRLNIIDEI